MGKRNTKRLEAMRSNPRDDWTQSDVQALCDGFDIPCAKPKGTSHFTVSHPSQDQILTIPAARPILPIYIKKLVSFIDAVQLVRAEEASEESEDGA